MGSKRHPETSYRSYTITPRHNPKVLQHLLQCSSEDEAAGRSETPVTTLMTVLGQN